MRARLTAVAVALLLVALGIGLGAGPLQHGAADRDRDLARQKSAVRERDQRIEQLVDANKLGASFASATAAQVLKGTLTGRKIAVVVFPGVESEAVDLLRGLVHAAGGEVTAQVALSPTLLAGSGRGLLDALTSQMVAQTSGLAIEGSASGYQRFGSLLARAIGVPPAAHALSAPYDSAAISIVEGLKAAKVLDNAQVTARAGLTLVVLPTRSDPELAAASLEVLTTYGGQIPSVIAAPAAAAAGEGLLAKLRAATTLVASTVDSLETPMGRVSSVLALAARTRGIKGAFGAVGKLDAAVPPVS